MIKYSLCINTIKMKKLNYLLPLLFCVILFSCNGNKWEEVSYVEGISQGDLFKIEPLENNATSLSGADLSFTDFSFTCISLQAGTEIQYTGATYTSAISSQGVSVTNTIMGSEFETWPASVKDQTVKITLVNLPPPVLKGKGKVYFFLADTAGVCISNIIACDLTFR